LERLIQVDASMTKNDQLVLIVPPGTSVPKLDFQGAFGVAESKDLQALVTRLNFSGVRPLREVWSNAKRDGQVRLRGGPKEEADVKTGITFVTVCSGTFTMGSKTKDDAGVSAKDASAKDASDVDLDASSNETPQHPVTLSTFEISRTEITAAQY